MRQVLIVAALLSLPRPYAPTVVVHGEVLRRKATLVWGEVFVPLSALERLKIPLVFTDRSIILGPAPRQGGAPVQERVEGCLNK